MLVAVFGDSHAHAEALDAVVAAAAASGAQELWSLGDMVGRGPDAEHVVARTRELCRVALVGNHDYGVTGSVDPLRFGDPGSPAVRSLELAAERLPADAIEWLRSRRPAARRDGVQCWHGGPHNAVREYVGPSNAAACLGRQREPLGLVGHTHEPAAWHQAPDGRTRRHRIRTGEPLDISAGKWLLNPGAAGAPTPSARRLGWWGGLDAEAGEGAFWLVLDSEARTATWLRAPYDPAPARARARQLGLDDDGEGVRPVERHGVTPRRADA
jgi:predicted phosphodiesterase